MAKVEPAIIENATSAIARIQATFNPESTEQPTQEDPTEQVETEVDTETDESEQEDTEDNTEEDEGNEESEQDTPNEPETYKVKVNGEEIDVSIDDLTKGYMMESDYRQKTSALSAQRKEIEEKTTKLGNLIEDAEATLSLELEDLDSSEMRELKEDDPKAYYEKRDKIQAKVKKLEDLKKERNARIQEQTDSQVKKEAELLQNALPEWLDQDAAQKDLGMINDLWKSYGFTEDDLGQFVDHRLILLSREAALYRKLKNAKPESKKVKQPPKGVKPGSTESKGRKSKTPADERRKALKDTGKMGDAAKAIADLL